MNLAEQEDDRKFRQRALELAVQVTSHFEEFTEPGEIVELAEAFRSFLKGPATVGL